MLYETGLLVLMFVILALVIGAAVRHLLKGTQVPYTVALLIIGLILGFIHRTDFFVTQLPMLANTLDLISDISPHLILFVFLPTLIFESAFAMEVHLFRRMFAQIAILAVPGLLIATLLSAGLAKWMFPWEWSWALCLMFGALISATDPVAVVALLKEVSSRKRLETLIEGESLLNDGTAIVFFTLFYGWVVATAETSVNPLAVAGQFTWVVSLGLIIGIVIGGLCILWIGRVFNDPMIEISLSIAAAYLVFFLAESIHVSGVVAVVALALLFAGIGRTRISPEVAGFLHHFWEMMAHMANTLIFLLVGVLVATRVPLNDMDAWRALGILYIGILIIRAFSVTLFMPVLKRIGIGINFEKAAVLVWGGLRGAVSLALALTVAADDLIPKDVSDRILFLCAGIVVLTILINGSTMGMLLKWLGLSSLPPAKQATVEKAEGKVSEALNQILPDMMKNEFLKGANWENVKSSAKIKALTESLETKNISDNDLSTAFQRRLLETERQHYWTQFEQGTLGKSATSRLVEAVEHALDGDPKIGPRTILKKHWKTPPIIESLRGVPIINHYISRMCFDRLALGYDVARGFIQAQDALESHIDTLAPNKRDAQSVRNQVEENKRETIKNINDLRTAFPEMVHALETQAATRLLLNRERAVIQAQLKQAVLDKPEAERMISDVEKRMKDLQKASIISNTVSANQLIQQMPWTKTLSDRTRQKLSKIMEHGLYNPADVIADQGKPLFALGIIASGTVCSTEAKDGLKETRILGPGETLGALSLLSGYSPSQFKADAIVDIIWLRGDRLKPIMAQDPDLATALGSLIA